MNKKIPIWILQIGVAATFFCHGWLAFFFNPNWLPYLLSVGLSVESAEMVMPLIGAIDILLALMILIRPYRYVLFYCIVWAFATALIRPLSGEPIWTFVEHGSDWAAPLALYWLLYKK